jgi:two-component system, chemotaxis family, chemotaxis protein CheY
MRALVVDDSKTMRTIIGRILKQQGFEVAEAGDGKEALERLAAIGACDVALVDWNMPTMNGYELVCAVRADSTYAGMKMLMVTTESDLARVQQALEAGADEFVMKPFTPEALQDKLAMIGVTP